MLQIIRERCREVVLFCVLGSGALLYSFLTKQSVCVFYHLLGIPCPACGMTRSYLSLIKLDISKALYYHPLFFLVPIMVYAYFKEKTRLLYGIMFLFIIVWIIRMVLYFGSSHEVFRYNERSVIEQLKQLISH
ncbi:MULTISPECIES: DUF2752 domain-containing protein [unclassified Granulicatella]|uniref:DUF2752 domain-containing protein n=1 Tax=unclassified Granulicatella TaxID=2630493 RepID=UPI00107406D0|nr:MULTISPECIES: DUF2752 domain-containing protein [unclassified Granulicatella]MBF0780736.1 DUF2752 domain-containing protein [Granulicatella sp. 19428wC4_WM01]TFU94195.1 DUF2752 domain-containing protein [Granulicatella sp. WM01]